MQKKELGERELFIKTKETQISAQTEALGKLHQESETLAQEKQFLLRQQVVKAAIDSKNFFDRVFGGWNLIGFWVGVLVVWGGLVKIGGGGGIF